MGEQVLWLAPGGLPATGIVLPGIYSNQAPAPSTDQVTEQGARAVDYIIDAALTLYYGPDSQVVLQTANTRLDTYLAAPPTSSASMSPRQALSPPSTCQAFKTSR